MILSIENFSIIASLGCIALFIISILILIMYKLSNKLQKVINNLEYSAFTQSAFVLTFISILSAIIYQEYYNTPVCAMCWQQRMVIYSILIVALVGSLIRDKVTHLYLGALSLFGLYLAGEHYYYHFVKYVLKDELSLPCDATGVSCSDSAIGVVFGFVTIPLMSICVFVSILVLAILAHLKTKS